jgi:hypothetical protein
MKKRISSPVSTILALDAPKCRASWFEEPQLAFGAKNQHPNPKIGIPLYGPWTLGTSRHKSEIHIGFIGSAEVAEAAQQFFTNAANGIADEGKQFAFPGSRTDRGFRCELRFDARMIEPITRSEMKEIDDIKSGRERFEKLVKYVDSKLDVITRRDHPLDYIIFALPEILYSRCRSTEYMEKKVGMVHRDLRRAFKAIAMRYMKPTQIFRETTAMASSRSRDLDHPSKIAWNLFTGMYFKVDGLPWAPVGLPAGSCFIGVSFYRPLGSTSTLRTSVVQAFDEHGEGLVLRGHDFHWDEKRHGRSPHLPADLAHELVKMVLDRYQEERRQLPQRVVLHKTSQYEDSELDGFESALSRVHQYDLVALSPVSDVRLARAGKYPPLRGTVFEIGDESYLYSTGFMRDMGGYPHGHVPSPLRITDHVGDTPIAQITREILILTKMNWNSANGFGLMPITLRFSRLVGDVLREVPEGQIPQPKYKFYI